MLAHVRSVRNAGTRAVEAKAVFDYWRGFAKRDNCPVETSRTSDFVSFVCHVFNIVLPFVAVHPPPPRPREKARGYGYTYPSELSFTVYRNFVKLLAKLAVIANFCRGPVKWRNIVLCSSEISLEPPRNSTRILERTKVREQRTIFVWNTLA